VAANQYSRKLHAIISSTWRASTVMWNTAKESSKSAEKNVKALVIQQQQKNLLKYAFTCTLQTTVLVPFSTFTGLFCSLQL